MNQPEYASDPNISTRELITHPTVVVVVLLLELDREDDGEWSNNGFPL